MIYLYIKYMSWGILKVKYILLGIFKVIYVFLGILKYGKYSKYFWQSADYLNYDMI